MGEEEVDEQVSTLKKGALSPTDQIISGLGLEHGTFKWNEVEEKKEEQEAGKKSVTQSNAGNGHGEDDAATAVDSMSVAGSEVTDRRFELTDITVTFPEGELSVITGPTASGKTALLASF